MMMLFRPPFAARMEVSWREIFALSTADNSFAESIRVAQLSFLRRHFPPNLLIALLAALLLVASTATYADPLFLLFWGLGVGTISALWTWRIILRPRRNQMEDLRALIRALFIEMLVVSLLWGLLVHHLIALAPAEWRVLVLAFALLSIATAVFSTAIMPAASLALLTPLVVLTVVATRDRPDVGLLVLGLMVAAGRATIVTSFAFVARLKTQQSYGEQVEVVRLLLNEHEKNGSDWLFELDASGRTTLASARFAAAANRTPAELSAQTLDDLCCDAESASRLRAAMASRLPFRDLLLPTRIGDELRWWQVSGSPKFNRASTFTGWRGVCKDVTAQQRDAQRIEELVSNDALTGLYNRRVLQHHLDAALKRVSHVEMMFVDLDYFKTVNDRFGHATGDALLREAAHRIFACVGSDGLVARLGGDEFAVLMNAQGGPAVDAVAEAIIAALSQPFAIDDVSVTIGASIGLASGPDDGATVEALLRAADLGLYNAKLNGRGRSQRFNHGMNEEMQKRRALEFDLKGALQRGELKVMYQPIVNSRDERISAFEALLRWYHPIRGVVPPLQFIPLAEEMGLIADIGAWVIEQACLEATRWPRDVNVAVNVSARQFENPDFVDRVAAILNRVGLEPSRLELELTETLFLEERPAVNTMLERLRALGVAFALDDFGTGYSSLGYLRRVRFNRIKIDRSFVQACSTEEGEAQAIVETIVSLAAKLGIDTTAEGAETRFTFDKMRAIGCTQVQGYLFGKPMPPDRALERLQGQSRPQAA